MTIVVNSWRTKADGIVSCLERTTWKLEGYCKSIGGGDGRYGRRRRNAAGRHLYRSQVYANSSMPQLAYYGITEKSLGK